MRRRALNMLSFYFIIIYGFYVDSQTLWDLCFVFFSEFGNSHQKKISRSEWFKFYIRDNWMCFLRRGGAKFSQQNQLRIFFNLVWSIKNTMATKTVWITSSNYLNWNGPQIWHESKYSERGKKNISHLMAINGFSNSKIPLKL